MSVDLSEFDAAMTPRTPQCNVGRALDRLDPERAEKLRVALASDYTSAAISRVVTSWGHKLTEQSVSRHRRGSCQC